MYTALQIRGRRATSGAGVVARLRRDRADCSARAADVYRLQHRRDATARPARTDRMHVRAASRDTRRVAMACHPIARAAQRQMCAAALGRVARSLLQPLGHFLARLLLRLLFRLECDVVLRARARVTNPARALSIICTRQGALARSLSLAIARRLPRSCTRTSSSLSCFFFFFLSTTPFCALFEPPPALIGCAPKRYSVRRGHHGRRGPGGCAHHAAAAFSREKK